MVFSIDILDNKKSGQNVFILRDTTFSLQYGGEGVFWKWKNASAN